MNTMGSSSRGWGSRWAAGALAVLLVAAGPALAQHSGGGGHGGGGGGGHFSGGGGHAGGFSGGHSFGSPAHGGFSGYSGYHGSGYSGYHSGGYVGGHVSSVSGYRGGYVGGHVAPSAHFTPSAHVGVGYGYARGFGYGRAGYGWSRAYWGGGYWHGGFWPRCYYGWGYPWFLGVLPAVYATYWWSGVPYYYANNVYYTYSQDYNGYVVTDPPPAQSEGDNAPPADGSYESAEPGQSDSPAPGPNAGAMGNRGGAEVYAYPKNGQSDEQQATDRYECHKWAVAQSGFDPTRMSSSNGNPTDYRRAMAACLDGRGYSSR